MEEYDFSGKNKSELFEICKRRGTINRFERKAARAELAKRGVPPDKIPFINTGPPPPRGSNPRSDERDDRRGRRDDSPKGRGDRRESDRGSRGRLSDRDRPRDFNRDDRRGPRRSPPRRFNDDRMQCIDTAFMQGLSFAQSFPPENGPNPNMGPNMGPPFGPFPGPGMMTPFGPVGPQMMPQMGMAQHILPHFGIDAPPMSDGPQFRGGGMREGGNDHRGNGHRGNDNGGRPMQSRDRSPFRQRNGDGGERRRDDGHRQSEGPSRADRGRRDVDSARRPGVDWTAPPQRFEREELGRSRSPVRSREKRDEKKTWKVRVTREAINQSFNERDLTVFGELLFEVIRATSGRPPKIEDTTRAGSLLLITCADEYSQTWLLRYVPQITLDGERLSAFVVDDMPVFNLVFPHSIKPAHELLHMLETFNDGLNTSRWDIRGSEQRNSTVVLSAGIPPEMVRYLENAGWKLFFGLQPVRVVPRSTQ